MQRFYNAIHSESLKLYSLKATKIVALSVLFLQGFFAFLEGRQFLSIGLSGTPETNPALLEAVPPLSFIGFDIVLFGLFPMVFLGALYGAKEFKYHALRTSLLATGKRSVLFFSKAFTFTIFTVLLSFLAIFFSLTMTHLSLGKEGLPPFLLNGTVWYHIVLSGLAWSLLTLLSFFLAFFFKSALLPLLFLLPQVYNIGQFLSERVPIGKALPVALANRLIPVSETSFSKDPLVEVRFLLLWGAVFGFLAYFRFITGDLKGEG